MPDDTEDLAVQLYEFFHAVENKTSDGMPQMTRNAMRRSPPQNEDVVSVYSRCLAKLEEDERVKLGQLIEKMFEALRELRSTLS